MNRDQLAHVLRAATRITGDVDGAIGEGSQFHSEWGYYAQGVEVSTSVLPAG